MALRATRLGRLRLSPDCTTDQRQRPDGSSSVLCSSMGSKLVWALWPPATPFIRWRDADHLLRRLLWRAYSVVQTPNDVLVDKLGLDIPPAPDITLEEIFPREVRIAWKSSEASNSIHKHIVEVNGVKGAQCRSKNKSHADKRQLERRSAQRRQYRFSTLSLGHCTTSASSL